MQALYYIFFLTGRDHIHQQIISSNGWKQCRRGLERGAAGSASQLLRSLTVYIYTREAFISGLNTIHTNSLWLVISIHGGQELVALPGSFNRCGTSFTCHLAAQQGGSRLQPLLWMVHLKEPVLLFSTS